MSWPIVVGSLVAGAQAAPNPNTVVRDTRQFVIERVGNPPPLAADPSQRPRYIDLGVRVTAPVFAENLPGPISTALHFRALPDPLTWDSGASEFRGALRLVLVDDANGTVRPLQGALRAQLSSTAAILEPSSLDLAKVNLEYPVTVRYVGDLSSVSIHFEIPSLKDTVPLDLPVTRGVLHLIASPSQIQGFGLETTTIRIESVHAGQMVNLATTAGTLERNRVELGEAGSTTVELRSAGIGRASVTATAPGFEAGALEVPYVWPVRFAIASVLGGTAGSLLKGAPGSAESKGTVTVRGIGVGVLAGLVIAIGAALGVNVTTLDLGSGWNEAGVFLLSGAGAWATNDLVGRLLGGSGTPA